MYTFDERLERVYQRRNPWATSAIGAGRTIANKGFAIANESVAVFDKAVESVSSVERMVLEAMLPVDSECVKKSLDAGEKVKEHLKNAFAQKSLNVPEFKYQGSVIANTQIKGASDIDLLVINRASFGWDSTGVRKALDEEKTHIPMSSKGVKLQQLLDTPSYAGDAVKDIKDQRLVCEECLKSIYSDCNITKGKSIQILHKTYDQKVDVVNCTWYDNVESVIHDKQEPYRGIRIFDKRTDWWMRDDYPFKKIHLMNVRDRDTDGRFKGLIRLLKTIKVDVEECAGLSSFDIYSIVYAMPTGVYPKLAGRDLVYEVTRYISTIASNRSLADNILQLDCTESVFKNNEQKFKSLQALEKDLSGICIELRKVVPYRSTRVYM